MGVTFKENIAEYIPTGLADLSVGPDEESYQGSLGVGGQSDATASAADVGGGNDVGGGGGNEDDVGNFYEADEFEDLGLDGTMGEFGNEAFTFDGGDAIDYMIGGNGGIDNSATDAMPDFADHGGGQEQHYFDSYQDIS